MKTRICFSILVLTLLISPLAVSAQDVEKLNARMLPAVWFSSLGAKEGEQVRVYAVIQNNSGTDFSGDVVFYVDDVEFARTSTSSKSGELTEASALWTTTEGKHSFQAKLEANLPEGKELLAYETATEAFEVKREVTVEEVKEETVEIAKSIVAKVDEAALSLAEKLETMKKPIPVDSSGTSVEEGSETTNTSEVLGTSNSSYDTAYNKGIDMGTFLLEKWMWTLSALAIGGLVWSFRV